MFTNKHFIVAMLVAPILALIAYFATDLAVGEKPQKAKAGESYKLAASPNCRFDSGRCTLKNGELKVDIRASHVETGGWIFTLDSNQDISTAALVIVPADDSDTSPINMEAQEPEAESDSVTSWFVSIEEFDKENDIMRVALSLGQSFYYVETRAIFPEFITMFTE